MSETDGHIQLPRGLSIPFSTLQFEYSRGSGPGGQNVNKVNSRVTLRFDLANAWFFPEPIRELLAKKLATRVTSEGVLVLHASEYRDQPRNREAAVARLKMLLTEALHRPKARKKTRPSRGSVERRIQASKRKGAIKKMRRKPKADD